MTTTRLHRITGPAALAALTALVAAAQASVLDVPGQYGTIQSAIDAAAATGDEIVVAPGAYNEVIDFMGKGVIVRSSGGPDVTTIDGTGYDTTVVLCVNGECGTTVLDGFTITGGAGFRWPQSRAGGGMYILGSSPTIRNCIFEGNVIEGTQSALGAGIYARGSHPLVMNCSFIGNSVLGNGGGGGISHHDGTLRVFNCVFESNSAKLGGGIDGDESDVVIVACRFTGNSSSNYGGGVFTNVGSTLAVDCILDGNVASINGGGMKIDPAAMIANCVFEDNHAHNNGGAIDLIGVSGGTAHSTLRSCRFDGNTTDATIGRGGAVRQLLTATYENCRFTRNEAGIGGGGVYAASPATVRNCTFAGNRAAAATGLGGGIRYQASIDTSATVRNSVFWGNEDMGGTDESAQIHVYSGILEVDYTCVQGGWSGPGGTGIVGNDPLFADPDGPDNDPDTHADNDYRLVSGSPCVDAGENATANENAVDLDGNLRLADDPVTVDTGSGEAPLVDMGSYEHASIAGADCNANGLLDDWDIASGLSRDCNHNALPDECEIADDPERDADDTGVLDECEGRGDLDGDGRIGVTDLVALLVAWGPCDYEANCGRCPSDFNLDGVVSILDLVILLTNWGT